MTRCDLGVASAVTRGPRGKGMGRSSTSKERPAPLHATARRGRLDRRLRSRSSQNAGDKAPLRRLPRLLASFGERDRKLLCELLDEDGGILLGEPGNGADEVGDPDDLVATIRERVKDGLGDSKEVESDDGLASA